MQFITKVHIFLLELELKLVTNIQHVQLLVLDIQSMNTQQDMLKKKFLLSLDLYDLCKFLKNNLKYNFICCFVYTTKELVKHKPQAHPGSLLV